MQASSVQLIGTATRIFNFSVDERPVYKPVDRMTKASISEVRITIHSNNKYIAEWWGFGIKEDGSVTRSNRAGVIYDWNEGQPEWLKKLLDMVPTPVVSVRGGEGSD